MARPETPLMCSPRRRLLAECLRELRAEADITYADMAAHNAGLPQATLKRIASDRGGVPKWDKVLRYYGICLDLAKKGGRTVTVTPGANLFKIWLAARMEERGTLGLPFPRPEFVHDQADLAHALHAIHEHCGAPSLRELQRNAGGPVNLPLSTAARIVSRQALPADTRQFKAYLRGCFVSENDDRRYRAWMDAWYKVNKASSAEMLEVLTRYEVAPLLHVA